MYFVFRLLVGLMFFLHGWSKFFGATPLPLASLMGVAGVVELLVGLGVFFGFFTRLAAVGGAIQMLVAFFKVHAPLGINPLANGGELALLFFAAFLVLAVYGAGKWSLEMAWLKKEMW